MSSAAVANPMVSAFDKVACAIKIQRWWREIKSAAEVAGDDVLECAICYEAIGDRDSATTSCGHKFHFSCMTKAMQRNSTCPMCRNSLVEPLVVYEEDLDLDDHQQLENQAYDEAYQEGFSEGRSMYEEYYQHREAHYAEYEQAAETRGYERGVASVEERYQREMDQYHQAKMDIQSVYESGVVDGRSIANEDLRLMRAQLERIKQEHDALRKDCGIMRAELNVVRRERDTARMVESRHVSVPSRPKENSKI